MTKLSDRVAIVTGGTKGIGRAIVELFVQEGARVITCARNPEDSETAMAMVNRGPGNSVGQVSCIKADMGMLQDIDTLVEKTVRIAGPPDVLVNNAAVIFLSHTGETEPADFQRVMEVNVRGYWYLARKVYPHMKRRNRGAIVNVASTHPYQTKARSFPYNASKGAILALTKAMAVDFGPDGIRANAVLPGIVATQSARDWIASFDNPEEKLQEILSAHPMRRMPTAKEVAQAVLFLASDDSSGVSGSEVWVDCGRQALRE